MRQRSKQILACAARVKTVAKDVAGPRLGYIDTRDLEQDGWLALLQASRRYDGTTKFSTFVSLRLRGAMIDGLRRWHPRPRSTSQSRIEWRPLVESDTTAFTAPAPSPETQLLATELQTLVARLPDRQRHVITRLFLDGATYHEIERELQIGKSGVHFLRKSALDDLRWQLTGEG